MTDKNSAAALYHQGQAIGLKDGPRASLLHLRAAIDLDPECSDYWLAYCDALARCGEMSTAIAVAEGARRNGLAVNAMDAFLSRPRHAQSLTDAENSYVSGLKAHREGRSTEAIELYRNALSLRDDFPEAHVNLGSALQAQGAIEDAIVHFQQAIRLKPDFAEAHFNLGNALALCGRDPVPSYNLAIALRANYGEAYFNLGIALEKVSRPREAMEAYRAAAKVNPEFAEAHVNLGVLLFAAGDLDGAIAAYDTVLGRNPELAAVHSNRGNALQAKDMLEEAARSYQSAIAADPALAEAHYHLANIRRSQGRFEDAVGGYRDALKVKPDFAEALYNVGYTLAEAGRIEEGFEELTRHADLLSRSATPDFGPAHKRSHDQEQRDHLGSESPDRLAHLQLMGGERLAGPALNLGNDIAAIQRTWTTARPQFVIVDDFLNEPALAGLRRFCAGSTIWREVYENGYLGAFPEHGLACPLLAQIAQELRSAYPLIFKDHPLLQLWAFKYQNKLAGIPLHADFAAVNVNFWITPDDANLDKDHGGLVIWDVPAPPDWDFQKYNTDVALGRNFITGSGAHAITIPYRANRAVIFDSDLFHETDAIDFKNGYLNRRINITLLYGRRAGHH